MVSRRKKSSKMGHDPLAWISEEDAKKIQEKNNVSVEVGGKKIASVEENVNESVEVSVSIDEGMTADIADTQETTEEQAGKISGSCEEVGNMIDLPIYFGIAQVSDVCTRMKEILENSDNTIEIKAEDIESVDAAAIQLLIAFSIKVKSQNKTIVWKGISSKLKDAMEILQVKEYLGVAA